MRQLALAGSLLLAACTVTSNAVYLTPASSAGYQVRLKGDLSSVPRALLVKYRVTAEPFKNGTSIGEPIVIRHANREDSPFRNEYPREIWAEPNVLRFSGDRRDSLAQRVIVANVSSGAIPVAALTWNHLVVFVDLARNSHTAVDVPTTGWMSVEGRFADGKSFDFRMGGPLLRRKVVVINIGDNGITFPDVFPELLPKQ